MSAEIQPLEDVTPICEALDLTVDVIDLAAAFYERALIEHPINRTPRVVAAGAVYLAALMENEKVTQEAVAEQSGVSVVSIRDAYLEIADHEGLRSGVDPKYDESDDDREPEPTTDNDKIEPTNPVDRFVDRVVIRSDCPVEPCASDSWVKWRSFAVVVLATIPGFYMMNQGFQTVGWIVAVGNMLITINIMSTRLNQRIEHGHTCGRFENSGNSDHGGHNE